jgi:hypothetical protein
VDAGCPRIQGDAALLRFALTTLIHRCEAAALDRRETPQIRIRAGSSGYGVQVQVASGAPEGPAGAAAERPDFDADAEVSAVNAVLAQHSAFFVVPEGDVSATQFTLQFEATA